MLMAPPILLPPPSSYTLLKEPKIEEPPLVFDASLLQNESNIPQQFIWPENERSCFEPPPPLHVPPIDLAAFLSGDPVAVSNTTQIVKSAFFRMPFSEKQRAQRKVGEARGYASSFTNRFSSKLPWKETLTLQYSSVTLTWRREVRTYAENKGIETPYNSTKQTSETANIIKMYDSFGENMELSIIRYPAEAKKNS